MWVVEVWENGKLLYAYAFGTNKERALHYKEMFDIYREQLMHNRNALVTTRAV